MALISRVQIQLNAWSALSICQINFTIWWATINASVIEWLGIGESAKLFNTPSSELSDSANATKNVHQQQRSGEKREWNENELFKLFSMVETSQVSTWSSVGWMIADSQLAHITTSRSRLTDNNDDDDTDIATTDRNQIESTEQKRANYLESAHEQSSQTETVLFVEFFSFVSFLFTSFRPTWADVKW